MTECVKRSICKPMRVKVKLKTNTVCVISFAKMKNLGININVFRNCFIKTDRKHFTSKDKCARMWGKQAV